MRSQVWQMERVTQAVEQVLHRPFAQGLTRIALRVGEKNGTIAVGTVALDEGSTIPLDILFEAAPGGMRQDNSAGQFVFRDLGPDSNGMRVPVDIIGAQENDLLSTECSIMREQDNSLISRRAVRQDIYQDGFPLALIWNPGDRGEHRDKATLSAPNAFSHRIEGITPLAQSNTPSVKAAYGAHAPSDRRRGKVRPCEVGNLASVGGLPISSFRFSSP